MNEANRSAGFARRFFPVWLVGVLGVLGLLLQAPPVSLLERAPHLRELPDAALRTLLLVNPLALMTAFAMVGAAVAHRVRLQSRLAGDLDANLAPGLALLVGVAVAAVLASIDAAFAGMLGGEWQHVLAQTKAAPPLPALLTGVLYGGLAEEVMMRWGVMSLFAWSLWSLQRRHSPTLTQPTAKVMWSAVLLSALVFAAGHLPALAQSATLTAPLVARTLFLNALAGTAYGWLFWRRGLECALLAHAATHLGLALARGVT